MKKLAFVFLIMGCVCLTFAQETKIPWQQLDEGLHYAEFDSSIKSEIADNKITVLKIDPYHYKFNLLSAKELKTKSKTALDWAKEHKQIAVINAGMYQADHKTNVGFMKNYTHTNNGRLNKNNTVLAFNRKDESVPEFQIIDRTCQDWDVLKDKYNTFTQSIRMVDCNQKNKWGRHVKKWSMVVIGKDKKGNALFVFSRSPYTVHDFINIILRSPLDIYNMMYLEGGPEASFFVNHKGNMVAKMGSYETGFMEHDDIDYFWPIPNVIGITKK